MSEQKCIFAESTEKSRALWKETARLFAKSPRLLPKNGFQCPLSPTTWDAGGSLRARHRRSRTQNHRTMNDLLNLFIFAQTPVEELRRWLAETPHRFERYAPGERIIAQGAECRSALLLTAGTANTEMVQDGRDLAIDVLKAPMLLASAFLFGTENRMPVSVTAATECEVWTVNKEALFGFMLQQPEAMRRFVAEVSDRAQFLSRRLRQLTLQSLRSRVLDFLRERGAMSSVQTAAQQLGVQRPSLSRVLSDLVAEGLVEKRDGAFVATDTPPLRSV